MRQLCVHFYNSWWEKEKEGGNFRLELIDPIDEGPWKSVAGEKFLISAENLVREIDKVWGIFWSWVQFYFCWNSHFIFLNQEIFPQIFFFKRKEMIWLKLLDHFQTLFKENHAIPHKPPCVSILRKWFPLSSSISSVSVKSTPVKGQQNFLIRTRAVPKTWLDYREGLHLPPPEPKRSRCAVCYEVVKFVGFLETVKRRYTL